ncbi:hypothetical protein T484DRAFT_2322720 [Baffinella frigidus]|nr:hypothetical protein T484DRAFT_2322720 [Cryptophyta sp. CCMP2293]
MECGPSPLAPVLELGLSAARHIGDGGSQPAPALSFSLPGFLPGSFMHETEMHATIFNLRGELMHAFVCYRVVTEGELPAYSAQLHSRRLRASASHRAP